MERLTISMSDEFAAELADFMEGYRYENRSEAVRDLARLGLKQRQVDHALRGHCVATLTYVFNHHTRELPKRLTDAHHAHHQLHVTTTHVHLDAENCLEVAILRGDASEVREFCKAVIAERGVTHGHVSFVPIAPSAATHKRAAGHGHAHPKD